MTLTPDPALIDDLIGRVSGRVLRPIDDGYDAARQVNNGLVDRTPPMPPPACVSHGRRGSTSACAAEAITWPAARSPTVR
jgi:hypothetical protein